MQDIVIEKISQLKEAIKSSQDYINFKFLNSHLLDSEEILKAWHELNLAYEKLETAKQNNSQNIEELRAFLKEKQEKYNSFDDVKKYENSYKKIASIYSLINFEIIYPLNVNLENKNNDKNNSW